MAKEYPLSIDCAEMFDDGYMVYSLGHHDFERFVASAIDCAPDFIDDAPWSRDEVVEAIRAKEPRHRYIRHGYSWTEAIPAWFFTQGPKRGAQPITCVIIGD